MKGVTGKLNRDRRGKELAMIHVGKKKLGLDDAAYRSMLYTLTGKTSSAKLDEGGRRKVIESMKRDGAFDDNDAFARAWKEIRAAIPEYRKPTPGYRPDGVLPPAPYDDQKALYRAAWHWLGRNGHLTSETWEAACETTFVLRVAKVAHLRFCTSAQTNKLIEAAKDMVRRAVKDGSESG